MNDENEMLTRTDAIGDRICRHESRRERFKRHDYSGTNGVHHMWRPSFYSATKRRERSNYTLTVIENVASE